ncbi:IucA/IucC family siderophore biosynthesis protein [Halobacteria archaeon AArc-dxtr1]|nr:IucA/IucC family siderophore biosynthesis protein [Halobacteria archaeon AArc-dxtr1]
MSERDRGGREPRLRTDAEREALGAATRYARTHGLETPAETAYLAALPKARREILRRFVRGVLRGRPAGIAEPRFLDPDADTVPNEPAPLGALDGDQLRSLAEPLSDRCRRLALLPFPASESVVVAAVAARHGYDRFRFAGPIRRWSADRAGIESAARSNADNRLTHPVDFVPLLAHEGAFGDAEQAERIRTEVAESAANLALARLAERVQAGGIEALGAETAASPFDAIAAGVPAADPASAFERIVTGGHPFHPAGKIRQGMSAAEGLAYAPEFAERIDLRFVAVDREIALETATAGGKSHARSGDRSQSELAGDGTQSAPAADGDRLTDRLYDAFAGLESAAERAIPTGRAVDEYAVVPVHPLQYYRTIPARYARQRAEGRVVPIPDYAHPATPQLNLRTVVPYQTDRTPDAPLPHLKLAIPVQTTNVVRTLSPHAVTNGPQVTDVVREIERRESFEAFGLLSEPVATCYHPPGGPHPEGEAFDDARHLSGLLRTNPAAHPLVPEGAALVVASALVADAPSTGRPLVAELIDRYGEVQGVSSTEEAALAFLEEYLSIVVPAQLRLLCVYGVALESHLQNSLVVFDPERAQPIAALVRDLGGIRVHQGRLTEHGLSIDPYPDSDLDADGEADCYRKLYYALFQNHLAELIATIATALPVDERDCWALVRTECERAFETLRADGLAPADRIRRDERALFAEPATHKALTAMRLRGKRHEYVTSEVSNPLSEAGQKRIVPQ